jgi:hypothetical protein
MREQFVDLVSEPLRLMEKLLSQHAADIGDYGQRLPCHQTDQTLATYPADHRARGEDAPDCACGLYSPLTLTI